MVNSLPQNVAVVLRINSGSFAEGFPVELRILENGRTIQEDSNRLIAAPKIQQSYQEWASTYQALGRQRGNRIIGVVDSQVIYKNSLNQCLQKTQDLTNRVRNWFQDVAFQTLRDRILANVKVKGDRSVPIIINSRTKDREQDLILRKLPWHLWDLFNELNNAEVALMTRFASSLTPLEKPIKVLAIFGSSEGLNLEEEQLILQDLEKNGAEIVIKSQPTREQLHQQLHDRSWDILFFAGHIS
jgi:branched-chain amino acid transport system substrate-binding protein